MDCYVTFREFKSVLKDIKKLQGFLINTFGSKFEDFQCGEDEDITEVESSKDSEAKTKDKQLRALESSTGSEKSKFNNFSVPIVVSSQSLHPAHCNVPQPNSVVEDPLIITETTITPNNKTNETPVNILTSTAMEVPVPATLNSKTFKPAVLRTVEPHVSSNNTSSKPPTGPVRAKASSSKESTTGAVPVDIESMEGGPSPAKRPNPGRQPSFRTTRRRGGSLSYTVPGSSRQTLSTVQQEENVLQCDKCDLFVSSAELASHKKNHTKMNSKTKQNGAFDFKKPQICPLCKLGCENFQAYKQHCVDFHPEGGYPCPVCKSKLKHQNNLQRHMTTHQNLKFECDICGKSYNRVDNLRAHSKLHKGQTESSIFYCQVCNTAFSSKTGRDTHLFFVHPDYEPASSRHRSNSSGDDDAVTNNIRCRDKPDGLIKLEDTNRTIEFEYEGDEDDL